MMSTATDFLSSADMDLIREHVDKIIPFYVSPLPDGRAPYPSGAAAMQASIAVRDAAAWIRAQVVRAETGERRADPAAMARAVQTRDRLDDLAARLTSRI